MRGWYHRVTRRVLGLGAVARRLQQMKKGIERTIDHPPPRERLGLAPAELAF